MPAIEEGGAMLGGRNAKREA